MEFDGSVVWITGASSGIGASLARACAQSGAALILSGRNDAALAELAGTLAADILILPFEATDMDALPAIAARAWNWRGKIDLLVNNAGISQRSLALDTDFSVYRRIMEVDFFAPVALTQLILPHMVERRSGHLAVISSIAGKVGVPLRTGYCAAKHAVIGYFDALRAETEAAYGLRVTTIMPGSVRTGVAANALTADGSVRGVSDRNIDEGLDPDDVAQQIVQGLRNNARELYIAAGSEALAPQLRAANPDAFFDLTAEQGAQLAQARAEAGAHFHPDPVRV